jgi:hypothetical protein
MAKGKHRKRITAQPAPPQRFQDSHQFWVLVLAVANLVFFWVPLTADQASIQWDAADYYYVVQKYFAAELHAGRIPFWTPFVWSGYPFLADPQVGAWYPLNWPFFLIGVSPRTIQIENLLHSLVASVGAYFLAFRLVKDHRAAAFAGSCYGLCGWFVGHSSHTTMIEAAAWLPWLLLSYLCWVETRESVYTVTGILIAGLIVVAGHFQTSLYSFLALGLVAIALCVSKPGDTVRRLLMAALIPAGGTLLSAIHTLPGLELARQSLRATFSGLSRTEGFIRPDSLVTMVYPNFYGAIGGSYWGPPDITQYYFYAGLLLVPLAIAGVTNRRVRWLGVGLFMICAWYAGGRGAGLYLLMARLPAFSSIRAPVNIWFVPTLGLALLAAAGFVTVTSRWKWNWLPAVLLLVTFADLWYWNSARNPLLYARYTFDELYGNKEQIFAATVVPHLAPLTRFEAPEALSAFGPMSHPLDTRTEVSYGYGPLKLQRYLDFTTAMQRNPKLRDDLNISGYYAVKNGRAVMKSNPSVLPRANFPKQLVRISKSQDEVQALVQLDPHQAALVPADMSDVHQDPAASVEVVDHAPGAYHMRYQAATDSLLRISAACFPGWHANVDGRERRVFCVDRALTGVVVPAGSKELTLNYHPTYFPIGAAVTLTGLVVCLAALVRFSKQSAVGRASA